MGLFLGVDRPHRIAAQVGQLGGKGIGVSVSPEALGHLGVTAGFVGAALTFAEHLQSQSAAYRARIVGQGFQESFLGDVEPLIQVAVPLQVVATVMLLIRHRSRLGPSSWGPGLRPKLVRTGVLGLVAVVALVAALVVQLSGGADIADLTPILLSMDHTNFILVMTSLIFAVLLANSDVKERLIAISYGLMVVGAVGFVVGLLLESAPLKRVFTPILGLGLLHGIFSFLMARQREAVPSGR